MSAETSMESEANWPVREQENKSSFSKENVTAAELKGISDDQLLFEYGRIQQATETNIKIREIQKDLSEMAKGKNADHDQQDYIENHFKRLGLYRSEIERRGLKANTMEERKM